MQLVFYNNASDDDTINKALTPVITLDGNLKNDCSIENPSITIKNSGMINANYCYIPEFGRYYYVTEQTIIRNNIVRIDMTVDVLESFKNQILLLNVIVDNSTSFNDKYIQSDVWKTKVKTKTDVVNFTSGLNDDGSYILITAGG